MVSFCFVCPCYILAREPGNDVMSIARTARAALTKSSPVPIWLYYFEKCFSFNDNKAGAQPFVMARCLEPIHMQPKMYILASAFSQPGADLY
jgi:hypothetical protein